MTSDSPNFPMPSRHKKIRCRRDSDRPVHPGNIFLRKLANHTQKPGSFYSGPAWEKQLQDAISEPQGQPMRVKSIEKSPGIEIVGVTWSKKEQSKIRGVQTRKKMKTQEVDEGETDAPEEQSDGQMTSPLTPFVIFGSDDVITSPVQSGTGEKAGSLSSRKKGASAQAVCSTSLSRSLLSDEMDAVAEVGISAEKTQIFDWEGRDKRMNVQSIEDREPGEFQFSIRRPDETQEQRLVDYEHPFSGVTPRAGKIVTYQGASKKRPIPFTTVRTGGLNLFPSKNRIQSRVSFQKPANPTKKTLTKKSQRAGQTSSRFRAVDDSVTPFKSNALHLKPSPTLNFPTRTPDASPSIPRSIIKSTLKGRLFVENFDQELIAPVKEKKHGDPQRRIKIIPSPPLLLSSSPPAYEISKSNKKNEAGDLRKETAGIEEKRRLRLKRQKTGEDFQSGPMHRAGRDGDPKNSMLKPITPQDQRRDTERAQSSRKAALDDLDLNDQPFPTSPLTFKSISLCMSLPETVPAPPTMMQSSQLLMRPQSTEIKRGKEDEKEQAGDQRGKTSSFTSSGEEELVQIQDAYEAPSHSLNLLTQQQIVNSLITSPRVTITSSPNVKAVVHASLYRARQAAALRKQKLDIRRGVVPKHREPTSASMHAQVSLNSSATYHSEARNELISVPRPQITEVAPDLKAVKEDPIDQEEFPAVRAGDAVYRSSGDVMVSVTVRDELCREVQDALIGRNGVQSQTVTPSEASTGIGLDARQSETMDQSRALKRMRAISTYAPVRPSEILEIHSSPQQRPLASQSYRYSAVAAHPVSSPLRGGIFATQPNMSLNAISLRYSLRPQRFSITSATGQTIGSQSKMSPAKGLGMRTRTRTLGLGLRRTFSRTMSVMTGFKRPYVGVPTVSAAASAA